jgi:hypothetical protein
VGDALRQARDAARLEDPGLIAEPDLQRALEDVADLVLAGVDMEPVAGPGLERRFEQAVRAPGLCARQPLGDGEEG